jgi:hypothetical protein
MNDIIKLKSCSRTISRRRRIRRWDNNFIGNNCHNINITHHIFAVLVRVIVVILSTVVVMGYHHNTCTSDIAKQFQFADCYIPNLAEDLLLKDASFVMSHDSGTGYLKRNQKGLITNSAINLYSKNQLGDVYQQLDDGARALDIRPKLLTNGTIILHHGAVPIGVTLETLVSDAIRWSNDNPNELVLILHSNLVYPTSSSSSSGQNNNDDGNDSDNDNNNDNNNNNNNDDDIYNDAIVPSADTAVTALSQVYNNLGVTYVQCSDLDELTVGEAKELAALSSSSGGGGYLLAMDRHDAYASSCAKQNYVEDSIVTCYSNKDNILPCTDRKSIQHRRLKEYAMSSANNEPTDNNNILGPPASSYYYPFNEIQTLWQVDGISAALGVSHVSSIIDDNTKSHLNARIVDWIYDDNNFNTISLLVVDHVKLNGNALSSVLRNRCGQSELSFDYYNNNNNDDNNNNNNNNVYNNYGIPCGTAVPKPHLRQGKPLSTLSFFVTAYICGVFGIWIAIFLAHYRKHHNHTEEVQRLEGDINDAIYECGCHTTTGGTNVLVDDDNNDIIFIGPDNTVMTATNTRSKIKSDGNNKEDPLLLPSIN